MRSTVASVCPARRSTPPSHASSGNMWPGRRNSAGFASGAAQRRAVRARSAAEMPVVVSSWSTETVNAVRSDSVFSETICGRPSAAVISRDIGVQMRPRA